MKLKLGTKSGTLGNISTFLEGKGVDIRKLLIEEEEQDAKDPIFEVTLTLKFPRKSAIVPIMEQIGHMHDVTRVTVE